jgi:hypothetical protein
MYNPQSCTLLEAECGMLVPARVMYGITLEGVPKGVIIQKLKTLQYTIPLETKKLGEKKIDRNNIMCESVHVDVTALGGHMSLIYNLHEGIKRVIPLHIELLRIPSSIPRE